MRRNDEPERRARLDDDDCVACEALRQDGADAHTFDVAPADGGGWAMWSAALLRLLDRIGSGPTQVIIITQPPTTDRYVQFLIGHGVAHAEVGSNVYLMGDSRLSTDQEELLTLLGWDAPTSDVDEPGGMPANWTLPLIRNDWRYLTEMLTSTMIGILEFREHQWVEVRAFEADHPCRECSWADEA